MKNFLLAGIFGSALMISCSTAKTAQANRAEFMKLKGEWTLTNISYNSNYKVKPFDEGADAKCFEGSVWKLVPNNYTGSYTLNGGGDCPAVVQPIKFEVSNGNEFKFKKIAEGTKAKQNISGYSLYLIGQTDTSFALEQNIPSNGENVKIVYNFTKTSAK